MRVTLRIALILVIVCLLYPAVILGFYFFAPHENAKLGKVDTLIVLGCPTEPDGSPTPEQRERVMEGVREFKRGASGHIIMTGTAAHNGFVEAHSMAMLAEANGVPASVVLVEDQAHDTIQNIYYSDKIMETHGWHTTEVISSPYHLPRTALILRHYPQLKWETHAAHWPPEYGRLERLQLDWKEAVTSFRIRIHGFRSSKYLPN
ncbi:MAG TPA: YdcF family protein [Bryobacteraceae bacterium]|nr:YdcF family protein [Bryobacteraceae bacterium]